MANPKIDIHGNKHWYNNAGQLHREDGPAAEYENGTKFWYKNGTKDEWDVHPLRIEYVIQKNLKLILHD